MANALAKNSTLQGLLGGVVGAAPQRTAKVVSIGFDVNEFESGDIDRTNGQNKSGSGFYRTSGYISIPTNKWMIQLYANMPWPVYILYYNENKEYQNEVGYTTTGYCNIENYPYCRISFYHRSDYASEVTDFISNMLKIQYIENAPAENEYFLHNHLFNGNFEFDLNNDGVGDGWQTMNSPKSCSVFNKTQTVIPSTSGVFLRMESNNSLNGHKIYVAYSAYTPYDLCNLSVYGENAIITANTKYTRISKIVTAVNSGVNPAISCGAGAVEHELGLRNVMMIDLTAIYGSGNEPAVKQVNEIIDKYYGGYVPCEYVVKYDDSEYPVDVLTRLKNIDTSSDKLTIANGEVKYVDHYIGGELKSTINITRDKFGNLVSVEEV